MNIYLLTSNFPYLPGEHFLENEIKYWASQSDMNLTLLPSRANGVSRSLPENIIINHKLASRRGRINKILSVVKALISLLFWKEIIWLLRSNKFSFLNVYHALHMVGAVLWFYGSIRQSIKDSSSPVIIYSYWFDAASYAAALLRRKGMVKYLFARAHGYDVYEERRPKNYMPLKRQFVNDFDMIFSISEQGKTYLQKIYNISPGFLELSRLGVELPKALCYQNAEDMIRMVSVSSIINVKRLDYIIDALKFIADKKLIPSLQIEWIHIGDGERRKCIESYANKMLGTLVNISFKFLGYMSNHKVINYYLNNNIDVFINTSSSEGVPVSIMEAMSFGIPVIAPAIGGIPEIVNSSNGSLLSSNPSIKEIAYSITDCEKYKDNNVRKEARKMVEDNYLFEDNYKCFIRNIREVCR